MPVVLMPHFQRMPEPQSATEDLVHFPSGDFVNC